MSEVFNIFNRPKDKGIVCKGIGAQQHFKSECDLNQIIKKYPDGFIPSPQRMPTYGDFTAIGKGLQDSMSALQFVGDWFSSLPSGVRAQFDNDPLKAQQFVLSDAAGAVKLGILSPSKPAKPGDVVAKGAEGNAPVAEPQPAATTDSAPAGAAS